MLFFLHIKKDVVPHGVPDPIPPVPDKLDLPRLEADIPKFLQNSRAFEEEDKLWWARFFESRNQFYAPKEKPSTWLLDELIAIKARQQEETQGEEAPNVGQAEAVGGQESAVNPVASVPRPASVPDSVVSLISGQFAAVREVCSKHNSKSDLF